MCGIAGLVVPHAEVGGGELLPRVGGMVATLRHRGPDDEGLWADAEVGVALAHRRLSILDLSPQGRQPMVSASGRYVVTFNGEVYNFRTLRAELEQLGATPAWRGHSDTEILLACIERWGIEGALKRFVGMFAFALWDRTERALHLARDRLGEKPLYYGWTGGAFLFGSELKALRAYSGFDASIDRNALALYMQFSCVPAPYSICKGIYKLSPGFVLSLGWRDLQEHRTPPARSYWFLGDVARQGVKQRFDGADVEAMDELDRLMRRATGEQMVADVGVGAFLSGGIDSSAVVALMQAQNSNPVRTFSIGFDEQAYDEARYAKEVARHLGTAHTELIVTAEQAMAVIPRLPALYDEPFGDSSQIPTFLVAQLARRHVSVSLSGDGGDELFGGYNRYFWSRRLRRYLGWLPVPARRLLAHAITRVSPILWDRLFGAFTPLLPTRMIENAAGDKLHKLARLISADSDVELYRRLVSLWSGDLVKGATDVSSMTWLDDASIRLDVMSDRMMYLDTRGYLPDDILTKVDRAAMAVSLETRIPLLDHRIVEFAWRLPLRLKIRNDCSKWILRQVLYRYVPRELFDRRKQGFGIPLDSWLRGPLRDWAEGLISEQRLRTDGFLDPGPIRKKWTEHISGRHNWQHHLWDVLMFQAWLEEIRKPATRTSPIAGVA